MVRPHFTFSRYPDMTFEVTESEPVDAGYLVNLEDEDGNAATHTSYHTVKADAEAEALAIWNPS